MSAASIIILVIVGILFFFAIQRILKKGTCGGSCEGCTAECGKNNTTSDKN